MAFESISMVYVLIAATILSLGAIIYRGRVELIGGYDPNKVTDKEGLGRWVGSNLIFGGIYTLIFAILSNFVQILLIGIWMLGFTIIIARLMIGEKKYYGGNRNERISDISSCGRFDK